MSTFFKCVRPDGTDFYSGTVRWLPEDGVIPEGGWLVQHPTVSEVGDRAAEYLSVATVPTDCTGMKWPCRLLAVEPVGDVVTPDPHGLSHKRASVVWRVVAELPATDALGPQGAQVAALIERCHNLTDDEAGRLAATWDAAWDAARDAAWRTAWRAARDATWIVAGGAARNAAWDAAWDAAGDVARDAVWALIVRDLIDAETYAALAGPWESVMGPIEQAVEA